MQNNQLSLPNRDDRKLERTYKTTVVMYITKRRPNTLCGQLKTMKIQQQNRH